MLKPCVLCSGIDLLCESQLLDACQPLKVRVADNIEQQSRGTLMNPNTGSLIIFESFILPECHYCSYVLEIS